MSKHETAKPVTLKQALRERAVRGMTIISDVDGVHTSRDGGVKIGPRIEGGNLVVEVRNGCEVLDLVPLDPKQRNVVVGLAGFVDSEVWEFYQFHTPDGQAVQELLKAGLRTIIVSGRKAAPVQDRFGHTLKHDDGATVHRPEVHLGVKDKLEYMKKVLGSLTGCIFIGDGAQDAPLMAAVDFAGGVAVATADAEPEALAVATARTKAKGGEGAFAELVNEYLSAMMKQ